MSGMRPVLRETGLVLLVGALQAASVQAGGGREPGSGAATLAAVAALGQAVLLLQRRRRPVGAASAVLALYALQVATADVVVPVAMWVALWSLALAVTDRARALRLTAAGTALTVAVITAGELLHAGSGAAALLAGVTAAVGLAALLRRSERGRLEAVRAQGALAERLRITRDLHDLVGHGLGAVAVQSSTARMALEAGDEATAREALAAVEASSRTAMKEMRQLLGVLSADGSEGAPAPGLADIDDLVRGLRAGGVDVTADVRAEAVPAGIALCAYRVVQEALTNAVKHSPGSPVRVDVAVAGEVLEVSVVTRGAVAGRPRPDGTGVEGIRARVAAVGGSAVVGPSEDGWAVRAALPLGTP